MRLIDADEVLKAFSPEEWPDVDFSAEAVQMIISSMPTRNPRTGYWMDDTGPLSRRKVRTCSACGAKGLMPSKGYKFCPNCGAEMGVTE